MVRRWATMVWLFLAFFPLQSQSLPDSVHRELAFVSDTQAPMLIERIYIKGNHNKRATRYLMDAIDRSGPMSVFILGDVVSKGMRKRKWAAMDQYLASLRKKNIPVYALLGNHDVMGSAARGEIQFNKRFPEHVATGYFKVVDSIAVVMLNSNFKTLTTEAQTRQQLFYEQTLKYLDGNPGVRFTIVTCHHAPYSNSAQVGSSASVQKQFVPPFLQSRKARLFITGHAHRFERFQIHTKDFLTIGGGGGLHQPGMRDVAPIPNFAADYDPEFHYLGVKRNKGSLEVTSYRLSPDFSKVEAAYQFNVCCSP